MTPKLIIYYSENGETQYKVFRTLEGIAEMIADRSVWPCLIDLSFNPMIAAKVQAAFIASPHAAYCSQSIFHTLSYDGHLTCHTQCTAYVADRLIYPIKSMLGQNFITDDELGDLAFDRIDDLSDKQNDEVALSILTNSLDQFKFTVRTTNVLRREKLQTIGDLVQLSPNNLLKLRNFGRKSLVEIETFLHQYGLQLKFEQNDMREQTASLEFDKDTFHVDGPMSSYDIDRFIQTTKEPSVTFDNLDLTVFENFQLGLEHLTDREKIILIKRIGFAVVPQTLDQLGKEFKLTRERIRQIEVKAWKKLAHPSTGWNPSDIWDVALSDVFDKTTSPLSLHNLMLLDERFRFPDDCYSALEYLLTNILNGMVVCHKIILDGQSYFARATQDLFDSTYDGVSSLVSSMEGQTLIDVEQGVKSIVPAEIREFNSLFLHMTLRDASIRNDGGLEYLELFADKNTPNSVLRLIFKNSAVPVTNAELDEILLLNYPNLNIRTVRGLLPNIDGIFPFSHGSWGSLEMLGLTDQEFAEIKSLTLQFIADFDVEQFHSFKVLDFIKEREPNLAEKINEWGLSGLIRHFGICKYLGRNLFTTNEDDNKRVYIKELVVDVLSNYQRPMKEAEIKTEISKVRYVGMSPLQVSEPVLRLGRGYFVLQYWDAKIANNGIFYKIPNESEIRFWDTTDHKLARPSCRDLTDAEISEQIKYYEQGLTDQQSADATEHSPYALDKAFKIHKTETPILQKRGPVTQPNSHTLDNVEPIDRTIWTTSKVERLKNLWNDGKSAKQIAALFGKLSRSAVLGKVHRLGLSSRKGPALAKEPSGSKENTLLHSQIVESPAIWSDADLRKLRVLNDENYATTTIATILGRSLDDVNLKISQLKNKI